MSERVAIPGGRDVRGTLDSPGGTESDRATDGGACVVACPPHPQLGGSRTDRRLAAVADALGDRGVACLRFDYGDWDEGHGEQADARAAIDWARARYERVGLFGYSFGAGIAVLVAADGADVDALSVLAPPATLGDGLAPGGRVDGLPAATQVLYGERDETVDWRPVVERARERGLTVESIPADHHFVGQTDRVGEAAASFLADAL